MSADPARDLADVVAGVLAEHPRIPRLYRGDGGGWCLFVGRFRIRWAGRDFRPLFSELYGYRRWRKVGRLGVLWDRSDAAPPRPDRTSVIGSDTGERRCWCGSPAGFRADKGFIDCLANRMHDWRGPGRVVAADQGGAAVPEATRFCSTCGPGYRYGDEGCRHTPPVEAQADERDALRRVLAGERCRDIHGYGEGYACAACCSWAEHVAALLAAALAGRATESEEDPMTADPTPATGADQGGALTEAEVGSLLSAAFHAFGTHAISGHIDEYEQRIAAAVERIVAARLADERARFTVAAELVVQDVRAQRGDHIAGLVEDLFAAHFDRAARIAREGGQR